MADYEWTFNDGGRAAAGYHGSTRDCVTRAVAIASGLPYKEVYKALAEVNKAAKGKKSARNGIHTTSRLFKDYMSSIGFKWVSTMGIGTGCKVHLKADELPSGKIIVKVTRHFTAVIDGIINDTYDCSRNGTRCVYGYWRKQNV